MVAFLLLVGCQSFAMGQGTAEQYQFKAKVLKVLSAQNILVEPLEGEAVRRSADRIDCAIETLPVTIMTGDLVTVTYDGSVAESYPAKVTAITLQLENKAGIGTTGENAPGGITTVLFSTSDSEQMKQLLKRQEDWGFDIPDCLFDCVFILGQETYFYHTACRTVQNETLGCTVLTEDEKKQVHGLLGITNAE